AVTTGSAGHLNVHMEDGTVVALQAWDATGTTVGLAPDVTPTAPQVADPWFDTASRAGRLLARVGALGAVEIWE
ncbi:hypothetical protein, partial [Clostridioides difficile]|uniref:hypothetical protein n=1 Tax=Clostridioides difficile TaxID=1496 RepID=UPI001A9BD3A6